MLWLVNRVNQIWNRSISSFHDLSVKTNIRWLVVLSIWAYDRMLWQLSEDWQLVDGVKFSEYKLQRELEIARHQIQYYADYAYELQCQLLEVHNSKEENHHLPVSGIKKELVDV